VKITQQADMRQKLNSEGGEIVGSTPAEFASYIQTELKASADLVKSANVRPD